MEVVQSPAGSERKPLGRAAAQRTASVFVSAGEASGDWAGSLLAGALRARRPDLQLSGIGGRLMASAGVNLLADSSTWAAIGVFESLSKVRRVVRAVRGACRQLDATPPSALVLIDAGAVNMRLARFARLMGLPTLYYFPPGSWRKQRGNLEIRNVVDMIATPFPWSRDLLEGGRARVEWVGHPVVEAVRPGLSRSEAASRHGIDPDRPVVANAPGSRHQEVHYLLPVLAQAARKLQDQLPSVQFLMPIAPSLQRDQVAGPLAGAGVSAIFLEGMDYGALQLAQAAIVCSGSVTLEFACLGVPMVVVYRASRATTLQYRLIRGIVGGQRFAAMPNIIAGREIVRELLGSAAKPDSIAAETACLLGDARYCARVRADLGTVVSALGPPGASGRTAEMVLELIDKGGDGGPATRG
jgi:lipid-A-disaccharide synthase